MYRVARNVFLGRGTAVNFVVLREGRDLTLIDAGYPADASAVVAGIEQIGHRWEDVRAVLVTHAHVDHVGGLPALLGRGEVPVFAHSRELPNVHGSAHEQASVGDVVRHSWKPRGARWLAAIAMAGGAQHVSLPSAEPFPQEGRLDLPGGPIPVLSGGHTSGHTGFLLPDVGMLASGDALVTGHPLTRQTGPQLLPSFFAHDPAAAVEGLSYLQHLSADTLLPGHGELWTGDLAQAVERVRAGASLPPRRT
ncbi:MBL fold metallo-hydrolase [Subtercola sp. Z020]|uniref:MBL fold metallo-hydrolase n=1 Tax=Subtercola sp. Z020 TaxID=2080582 RepID=UPI000CE90685|nr:MBL fold metallo-hydrolase [Subtercola sp. Z020]PPF77534.1 MBL fold metallo-hydrolase [Subtercola sp. Z020]